MSKTIHRILKVIGSLGLSARQFDLSIGTANGYTLRMHKNNASVGSDVIERIKEVYPQINLVWLITGKGPMFVEEQKKPPIRSIEEIKAFIEEEVKKQRSEDKKLWSEEKKQLLDELTKEIESLKDPDQ